jgi:DNA-binding NarL/FixJ family response regulator
MRVMHSEHASDLVPVAPPRQEAAPSICVVSSIPAFRDGICAWLRTEGFITSESEPGAHWARSSVDAALVSLFEEGEWDAMKEVASRRWGIAMVAVLPAVTTYDFAGAVRLGAAGVVARDATREELVEAFQAALAGRTVVPLPVARSLVERVEKAPMPPTLGNEEIEWLRAMARGVTVSEIARSTGYSERQMYRLLGRVYEQIGASGRADALIQADRLGILDHHA